MSPNTFTSMAALPAIVVVGAFNAAPSFAQSADERLTQLLGEDFQSQMRLDPLDASRRGERRFDAVLPDLSRAAREWSLEDTRERLAALEVIDPASLSDANKLNAALLRYELRTRIDASAFEMWQMPITQQNGPQNSLPQLPDFLNFTDDRHLEDYAARLEAVPEYLDQLMANMREGMKSGRTPPRIVMGTVSAQAAAHGGARYTTDPESHAMFRPFVGKPGPLADRARAAIAQRVAPAFERFAAFLESEYVPACRQTIAASDLPEGPSFYNFQIRRMTTTDLTADQVHQMGLREVARIREEMMRVIARSDFAKKDELQAEELFKAFLAHLRTDPRFYHTTPEALLQGYREIAKRIDPDLARLFGTLPRLPYGVREMPRFIATAAPTAYYYPGSSRSGVPGWFIANTYRLDQRPKYEMIPLTLHEAMPGHHLQIALAQELSDAGLPEWRTTLDYTVFVEGWALYAERLGLEMGDDVRSASNPDGLGLFTDPYDDFGRLTYEMWRAMRLVVDTGLHAQGWSRDRAITFMLENSALSPTNIEREVDRYIAWPAQALAYKIGELRIRDLRAWAEQTLGPKFDIRGFHDAVLLQGAVPLDVLDAQVRAWVDRRSKEAEPR